MKTIKKLRNRKGVSPVIATVILVAITITVAVAVAYWMSGIAGQYTQFEKIEIQSAICTYEDDKEGEEFWKIEITLKNSGTKTATLTMVFVNEVMAIYPTTPGYIAGSALLEADVDPDNTLTINSGESRDITVGISNYDYAILTAGTTINIKIHSAAGMDYIRLVQLV